MGGESARYAQNRRITILHHHLKYCNCTTAGNTHTLRHAAITGRDMLKKCTSV